jgi:hypothetical protein
LRHDHLPIEKTSRPRSERVREPATSNGQNERVAKRDRELGPKGGSSGQKVEPAWTQGPSAATVTNLKPNTKQSEQAESGLGRAEASMRIGQGYSGARPQKPSDRVAADALPVRLVRKEMFAEVDNRSAENETATTTVASNPADSSSTTAGEEAEWAELRARLARLRGDLELTTELEQRREQVASSRVMEDRPPLAQATDEEAQEAQLTAELCAIPCQVVLDVSRAHGTPRGQTPSKVTGTTLRVAGRDDETIASGGGRTRLNPHAAEFVPSDRFAIDVGLGQPHSEHSPPAEVSGRPRVGVATVRDLEMKRKKPRSEVEIEARGDPPRPQAIRVRGYVEETEVVFLVDSGANTTVISEKIWDRLPQSVRNTGTGQHADVDTIGGIAIARDRATCSITINGRTIVESVLVMDIDMDGILGLSSMAALGCRVELAGLNMLSTSQAWVDVNRGKRLAKSRICHLVAKQTIRVPARCEKMVPCELDEVSEGCDWLVGGDEQDDDLQLRVVRSVTGGKSPKTQVRLVNPTDKAIYVTRGQTVTTAEEVQVIDTHVAEDNQVRSAPELPDHLQLLFTETCAREKLNEDARAKLRLRETPCAVCDIEP